jgi:hypothetical protein
MIQVRKLSFLLLITFLLVSLSGTALAWSERIDGRPQHAESPSLSIWQDRNDEFHVKSTNMRRQHVFTGVIQTNGRFYDIDDKNLEHGDFVRVDRDRNTIRFRFTGRGLDEFDFKVRRGDAVSFDLNRDGRDMPNNEIFIGRHGWHPRDNRFTLR